MATISNTVSGWEVTQSDRKALGQVNVKALSEKLTNANAWIDQILIPLYEAQGYTWNHVNLSFYNLSANHTVAQAEVHKLFLKKLEACAPKSTASEEIWKENEVTCRKKVELNIKVTLGIARTNWDLGSIAMKQLIEIVKNNGGNWNEECQSLFYKESHFPMSRMKAIVTGCLNPIAQSQRQASLDEKENRYVTSGARMYTADEIWSSDPVACKESLEAACRQALKEMQK